MERKEGLKEEEIDQENSHDQERQHDVDVCQEKEDDENCDGEEDQIQYEKEHEEEDQIQYEKEEEEEDGGWNAEGQTGWNEEGQTGWDEGDGSPACWNEGWKEEGHTGWDEGDGTPACWSWILHEGYSFEEAKREASTRDKWLIISLQSPRDFDSWLLDQHTWTSKTISEILPDYFIFWQCDVNFEEGMKVLTYYKLKDALPAVLLIDPITGEKMWSENGFISPEALVEHLSGFMDTSPHQRIQALQFKTLITQEKEPATIATVANYPPLPSEEPKQGCRIAIRLPSGLRRQRNFLETDPVQLLWSFCNEEAEISGLDFELIIAIPGAVEYLDYETKLSFGESGWSNSLVSVKLLEH